VQAHQTQNVEPTEKIALTSSSSPSGRLGVLDDFPMQTQGDGEFGVVCPHNYRFGVFGLDL
jgi:hypothetical protein